jgi:hypothetical protein
MKHGDGAVFFRYTNVPIPQSCYDFSLYRTCQNGTLSGDPAYKVQSCAQVVGGAPLPAVKPEMPVVVPPPYPTTLFWPTVAGVIAILLIGLAFSIYRMRSSMQTSPQIAETAPRQPEKVQVPPEPQKPPEAAQNDIRDRLREQMFGSKEPPRPHHEEEPTPPPPSRGRGKIVTSKTYEF